MKLSALPWVVAKGGRSVNAGPFAKIRMEPGRPIEEIRANMNLIASSPELLRQLKKAVKDCPCSLSERLSGHRIGCFVPDALEVIAAAEGRTP